MTNDRHPILVLGATGRQGGSVARALLKANRSVRALVLDPDKPAAIALKDAGAQLVPGSFADRDVLRTAMIGASGVFSVLPGDMDGEQEKFHGIGIADLASESGITHFVYSSGASVGDSPTGIARFDAKLYIEAHIRELPLTATIIRPTIFMEMLVRPGFGLDTGRLRSLVRPDGSIQLTAVDDIGKLVAAVFAARHRFSGLTLRIASDRVTGRDLEMAMTDVAGHPISYARLPDDVLAANPDLSHMAQSLEDGPLAQPVDLDLMRELNPELLSFRAWLASAGRKAFIEALGSRMN